METTKTEAIVQKLLEIPLERYTLNGGFYIKGQYIKWSPIHVHGTNKNYISISAYPSDISTYRDENWSLSIYPSADSQAKLVERIREVEEYLKNLRADFIINE